MSIGALSASDPTAASAAAQATPASAANEQRFLKLLVTQLKNQDPLNPMENAQLTSQLAQMSTVSGIEKMNATLQTMLAQSGAGQMMQAAGMVGRWALAPGSSLPAGEGPAAFAVELPSSAASVQALVTDAAGTVVRTIDLGAQPGGLHDAAWDRLDDAGRPVPAGAYQVRVVAANGPATVPASTLVYEQVGGVAPGPAGVSLDLASGRRIALSDVRILR
ncbi:flagellar hook assembly protein FlgD [Ramlibacter sp. RBP-2]|uniref:Basal-body rod modification protein FlgD n=1 Tax=Ramlibacter lithotrophicus TaxID=2606681 RepID=A0A7X6DFE9_9BURK|nr:flagellar hook assembly protein FlgD [Ramlibacter lithotrophicus]NKE66181.1 flagellar hook assembly protein FlgD [Ramlibacter lithotrophicus]